MEVRILSPKQFCFIFVELEYFFLGSAFLSKVVTANEKIKKKHAIKTNIKRLALTRRTTDAASRRRIANHCNDYTISLWVDICVSWIKTSIRSPVGVGGGGGGVTPYNGLYGKAPLERVTFLRLQVYETAGWSILKGRNLSFWSVKVHKKWKMLFMAVKKSRKSSGLVICSYPNDNAFKAVKRDAKF